MRHVIDWKTGKCANCGKKLKSVDALKNCKGK